MKRKKHLEGRLLAVLLTLCLILGLLPASALAEAANEAAAAAEENGTSAAADSDGTYSEVTITNSNVTEYITATSTSGYTELANYYYKSGETYYRVYYTITSSNMGQTTTYAYSFYYLDGSEYKSIGTIGSGPGSSGSITLYYYDSSSGDSGGDQPDEQPDGDGSDASGELDADAYRSDALVYWDLNDDNDNNDPEGDYIQSVTLGSTTTTDSDGNSTTTANTVTFYESVNSYFGTSENGTNYFNNSDSDYYFDSSNALSLDDVYDIDDGGASEDATATLTITPADGYYVSSVYIVCSAYVSTESMYVSPYSCSTYTAGKAYTGDFSLSSASGSDLTLTVSIDSLQFAHNGYLPGTGYRTYTYDSSGNIESTTYNYNDNIQAVYFILITVEEIPTPAYVEYDFGNIVAYIEDELGGDASNYSAFSTASGWTDENDGNVYSDIESSNSSTSYPNTVTGTGGVMTDGTQFEYVYENDEAEDEDDLTDDESANDDADGGGEDSYDSDSDTGGGEDYSGDTTSTAAASNKSEAVNGVTTTNERTDDETTDDETTNDGATDGDGSGTGDNGAEEEDSDTSSGYSSWKHYANSIKEDAIEQAAAAGYVFAGWAVTYYTDAKVASTNGEYTKNTSNYNSYSITFSTDSGTSTITTMVAAGDEVKVAGHVRLVAQWIKINTEQVIDYGLPVSVDVSETLLEDAEIYAITSDMISRASVTQTYDEDSVTTRDLSGSVTADVSIETDENSTTTATGEYGSIAITKTSSGDNAATTAAEDDSSDGTSGESSVTYTLSEALDGVEDFDYTVKLTYGTSTTLIENQAGILYIIPATSMYYEDSFGATIGEYKYSDGFVSNTVLTNGNLISYSMNAAFWVLEGGTGTTAQETGIVGTTNDSTYGADEYYLGESNLGDSDGSSMYVDTSEYAASFSYTFTGDGTAIYTRTLGNNDGEEGAYIRVIIWEGNEEGEIPTTSDDDTETEVNEGEEDGNGVTAVGTWFIDTRIVDSVSDSSTLYNIPIFSKTDLDYGTYTVSVLVYKEGAPVQATYTTDGRKDDNGSATLARAYSDSETTTNENGEETTTYDYLYYVYQDVAEDGETTRMQLYYQLDSETGEVDYDLTGTTVTDYPVYYTSTNDVLVSYSVSSSGEVTENESTTSDANGDDEGSSSTTYYLAALYFLADDTSGGDFYLDGIRIYNPLGTASDNESGDEESTKNTSSSLSDWDIASAAYGEDDEANSVVINIAQKLAADAEEGYTGSDSFITLTDCYGDISGYNPDDTADYPDNEIYLDSSSSTEDEEENTSTTTYSVSFYLAVDSSGDDLSNYNIYLGLKAPDGTAGSVKINDTEVSVNSSADCYYLLNNYLADATVSTITQTETTEDGTTTTSTLYGYKVTITGDLGLIALTYIKVVGSDEFDIAYSSDVEAKNESSDGTGSGDGEGGGDTNTGSTAVSTLYLLSAASVESNEKDSDSDMLDDDDMAIDPDDSDSDTDTDSGSGNTEYERDESSIFVPETFTASITYLKLLRYASITVKTSSDVSYITVNGKRVTGRSSKLSDTLTFSYTASRISSGTTYEIIAYDSDGTASDPITVTAE